MVTKRTSSTTPVNPAKSVAKAGRTQQTEAALSAKPAMFQLPPGLYAIRALPNPKHQVINPVTLTQAPVGHAQVDFLPAAGIADNTFVNPNDCIAVRVMNDTATMVATEFHAGAALSVRLEVERIDLPKAQSVAQQVAPSGSAAQGSSTRAVRSKDTSVRLLGHIEGVGDTIVQDQWLGQPGRRARLEGFAIKVKGLPETVKLVYGCKFMSPTMKTQVSSSGQFVGTRRQAQAIRSVVFGLEGPGADQYQLVGQVAFSGAKNKSELVPIVHLRELHGSREDAFLVAIDLCVVAKASVTRSGISHLPVTGMDAQDLEEMQDIESTQTEVFGELQDEVEGNQDGFVDKDESDQDGAWTDDDIANVFGR